MHVDELCQLIEKVAGNPERCISVIREVMKDPTAVQLTAEFFFTNGLTAQEIHALELEVNKVERVHFKRKPKALVFGRSPDEVVKPATRIKVL